MQAYLRHELECIAARPTVDGMLERIRQRKARTGTRVGADELLAARDADRR